MRALGFPVKKEEVKKVMAEVDKAGTGRIGEDDFLEISACGRPACLLLGGAGGKETRTEAACLAWLVLGGAGPARP
jgi:hypothetical protein